MLDKSTLMVRSSYFSPRLIFYFMARILDLQLILSAWESATVFLDNFFNRFKNSKCFCACSQKSVFISRIYVKTKTMFLNYLTVAKLKFKLHIKNDFFIVSSQFLLTHHYFVTFLQL